MNKQSSVLNLVKETKLLQKVKLKPGRLIYSHFKTLQDINIVVYTEVSYANLFDSVCSAGGHIIFLQAENKNCVLSWSTTSYQKHHCSRM